MWLDVVRRMRILSLTPGTGGTFYCQNCLRDGQMVRGLRRRGHDVIVVPLYLPILLDSEGLDNGTGVFFGGVNVFLQQNLGIFRNTPRWLDKMLDSSWMLRRAAAREGSTRARDLAPMTYSMLQGRDGRQRKELHRFIEWLQGEPKPDLVHISNALLLGLAGEIRERLKVPIVCSLQDEDTWIDAMDPVWRDRCWNIIAEKARDVNLFVAVSKWYASKMAERARIPMDRMRVVPLGTEWDRCDPSPLDADPPVLGFLSRIHPALGFSELVDAFIELKKDPRLARLKLRATGGVTHGDRHFVDHVYEKLRAAGVADDVEIVEDFTKAGRQQFLRTLSVLSAPAPQGEAFGFFVLEAGACGVPVVQPDAGAFREVVEMTGGGIVYDPRDETALVESLKSVLLDRELARRLGRAGHAAVHEKFTADAMAANIAAVFHELVPGHEFPAEIAKV
ncbi:MAG: glycosyltransferase family 4 protein [Candidatus Hydrogenedentes bacterium]|nr:glycosyltransferase family 4 protein [Candidatus Hydrogenedentota bacterium]